MIRIALHRFHSGLSYRFGAYPPHRDDEVPGELRAAADEWEKYRNWKGFEPINLELEVDADAFAKDIGKAVCSAIYDAFHIRFLTVDSFAYELLDKSPEGKEVGVRTWARS